MPNENRKMYMSVKSTGTIPKVKHRNNNNAVVDTDRHSNLVSNNLGNSHELLDSNRQSYRNSGRNLPFYQIMDNQEGSRTSLRTSVNGSCESPIDSQPTSRKSSSGLSKCDNVVKFPDKKQIESKLSQIQEFLNVATAMKSNMKNTDEQQIQIVSIDSSNEDDYQTMDVDQLNSIIADLVDSESKLKNMLEEIDHSEQQVLENGTTAIEVRNELEHKVDAATRDLQMLKEHENLLLHLQLNAENQLREAKLAQAKLAKSASQNPSAVPDSDWYNDCDVISLSGASSNRNVDIRELEERVKSFIIDDSKIAPEQFQNQIDQLENRIQQIRDGNDNRSQLIHILDTRDAQLQAQHSTLQGKLQELQSKKQQVDQLVVQLQNMHEEAEEDEMGCQVKKIVNMKEQLAKLKDMLNLVQNTENSIEEATGSEHQTEIEEKVNRMIAKTDNLMQQNRRLPHVENTVASSNERHMKEKQVNKASMSVNERERTKLHAELRAKRKELEDLMCKQRAVSNLNQDVNSEKNSELGSTGFFEHNPAPNAWFPMDSNIFNTHIERQSSDSDDGLEDAQNGYSEMNSSGELNTIASTATPHPMPALNYPTSNYIRKRSQEPVQATSPPCTEAPHDPFIMLSSRSPARSVHSATPAYPPRECTSNKNQLQKQLELIKSVCDSMLDADNHESRPQQSVPLRVRNNLTPSPIYSEPHRYSPRPATNGTNNGNLMNVTNFPEAVGIQTPTNTSLNDAAAYNSWLQTNALQTQAFILNTLNQCCQMLWHQQKEISNIRQTVNVLQERCGPMYHDNVAPLCMQSNPCLYQASPTGIPTLHHPNANYHPNNYRHPATKINHTGNPNNAGSMPNLNGHCSHQPVAAASASAANAGPTNLEHVPVTCCNNIMNNTPVQQHHPNMIGGDHHQLNTNHVLHHNQNVPPSPIWNGQALNNQVAPGNRANNYWDNFRSYSRQNLFSTKSNDGAQNTHNERMNSQSERQHSTINDTASSTIGLASLAAKANSNTNDPTTTSTPTRKKATIRALSAPNAINSPSAERRTKTANNDGAQATYSLPPLDAYQSGASAADIGSNEESPRNNRNEWNGPKSKLFEELRENVFSEVATLITANEGRPHFLIQLFRDLQLISSDPLRRKALQSIQGIITNSLVSNNTGATRQMMGSSSESQRHTDCPINEGSRSEYDIHHLGAHMSVSNNESLNDSHDQGSRDPLLSSVLWPMLSSHNIREENEPNAQETYHDAVPLPYLNICANEDPYMNIVEQPAKLHSPLMFDIPMGDNGDDEAPRLQVLIQNGDLAEADQSRPEDDDEEGAIGGLLSILERSSSSNAGQISHGDELILETEDESEQGLDQVPTRLSNPPSSIGCSPKSQ